MEVRLAAGLELADDEAVWSLGGLAPPTPAPPLNSETPNARSKTDASFGGDARRGSPAFLFCNADCCSGDSQSSSDNCAGVIAHFSLAVSSEGSRFRSDSSSAFSSMSGKAAAEAWPDKRLMARISSVRAAARWLLSRLELEWDSLEDAPEDAREVPSVEVLDKDEAPAAAVSVASAAGDVTL